MKVVFYISLLVVLGCKRYESQPNEAYEYRERMEEEIMERQSGLGSYVDFKDNLENELRGTEEELMRMNKLNDSLWDELYKCQLSK